MQLQKQFTIGMWPDLQPFVGLCCLLIQSQIT